MTTPEKDAPAGSVAEGNIAPPNGLQTRVGALLIAFSAVLAGCSGRVDTDAQNMPPACGKFKAEVTTTDKEAARAKSIENETNPHCTIQYVLAVPAMSPMTESITEFDTQNPPTTFIIEGTSSQNRNTPETFKEYVLDQLDLPYLGSPGCFMNLVEKAEFQSLEVPFTTQENGDLTITLEGNPMYNGEFTGATKAFLTINKPFTQNNCPSE